MNKKRKSAVLHRLIAMVLVCMMLFTQSGLVFAASVSDIGSDSPNGSEVIDSDGSEAAVPQDDSAPVSDEAIEAEYIVLWYNADGEILQSEIRNGIVGENIAVEPGDLMDIPGCTFRNDDERNVQTAVLASDGSTELSLYFDVLLENDDAGAEPVPGTDESEIVSDNQDVADNIGQYTVEWYDTDLNLLKSEVREAKIGDTVSATDEDKAGFANWLFDEEAELNKLECEVNEYNSAVIWVMCKSEPLALMNESVVNEDAVVEDVPSVQSMARSGEQNGFLDLYHVNMTHYFIVDLSDYGGHRLVKENHTYYCQYELRMYPMFDWSELESGKFDYEFKEYTCSDPESIYGLNGTLYSGNLYWGTFYFLNKTDRLNASHYFGWEANLDKLVDHVPSGYEWHGVYWNAVFKDVTPTSGFRVDTVVSGDTEKTYEGQKVASEIGSDETWNLEQYINSDLKRESSDVARKFDYVFTGYEAVTGSGTFSDESIEDCDFDPDDCFVVIHANYKAVKRSVFTMNMVVNGVRLETVSFCKSNLEEFYLKNYINLDKYNSTFNGFEILSGSMDMVDVSDIGTKCIAFDEDVELNALFTADGDITLRVDVLFTGGLTGTHHGYVSRFVAEQDVVLSDYIDSGLFKTFSSYSVNDANVVNADGSRSPINFYDIFHLHDGSNVVEITCDVVCKNDTRYFYYNYDRMKEALRYSNLDEHLADAYENHYVICDTWTEYYKSSAGCDGYVGGTFMSEYCTNNMVFIDSPFFSTTGYYGVGRTNSYSYIREEYYLYGPSNTYGTLYFPSDTHTITLYPYGSIQCGNRYRVYTDVFDFDSGALLSSSMSNCILYPDDTDSTVTVYDFVDKSKFDADLYDYVFSGYAFDVTGFYKPEENYGLVMTDANSESNGSFVYSYRDSVVNFSRSSLSNLPVSLFDVHATYYAKSKANRITVLTSVSGNYDYESSKSELFSGRTFSNVGRLLDNDFLSKDDCYLLFDGYSVDSDVVRMVDSSDRNTDCVFSGIDVSDVPTGHDIHVVANFRMYDNYRLSYDLCGAEGSFLDDVSVEGYYTVTNLRPIYPGYDFLGWCTNENDKIVEYRPGDKIQATDNMILYAVWARQSISKELSIVYDTRGGSSIPNSVPVDNMFTITRRVPSLSGYVFVGWTVDETSTNPLDVDYVGGDKIVANMDLTLYALYVADDGLSSNPGDGGNGGGQQYPTAKTYTLTYDTQTDMSIAEQKSNTGSFTVTRRTPVKEGYVFGGWSLSENPKNASEVDYFAGDVFPAVSDVTLHAVFIPKDDAGIYKITYDTKGGSEVAPTEPDAGIFMVTRRVPDKKGYVFAGWSTDENASGIDYVAGDRISAMGNITLYAVWVKGSVANKYVLFYDTQGGTEVADTEAVDGKFMVTRRMPKMDGKVFVGWSLYKNDDDIDFIAGDYVLADKNTTLYAVYVDAGDAPSTKSYTITYDTRGGSVVPKTSSVNGMFTITRRVPELEGKAFAGWTSDKDSTNPADVDYIGGDSFSANSDLTLYALYYDVEVTVNTNGGSDVTTNITQIDNKYIINISITYKAGYVLAGWDTDGDGEPDVDPDEPIETENPETPIDAVWTLKITPAQYVTTNDSTWEYSVTWDNEADVDADVVRGIEDALIDDNGRAYVQVPDTVPSRTGYLFLGWDLSTPFVPNRSVEPYALLARRTVEPIECFSMGSLTGIYEEVNSIEPMAMAGYDNNYYQVDDKVYMDEIDSVYESGLRFTAMWEPMNNDGSNPGDGDGNGSVSDNNGGTVSDNGNPSVSDNGSGNDGQNDGDGNKGGSGDDNGSKPGTGNTQKPGSNKIDNGNKNNVSGNGTDSKPGTSSKTPGTGSTGSSKSGTSGTGSSGSTGKSYVSSGTGSSSGGSGSSGSGVTRTVTAPRTADTSDVLLFVGLIVGLLWFGIFGLVRKEMRK